MAPIRELRARFTADISLMKAAFRDLQTQASQFGPAVQRSTQQANRSYTELSNNAGKLRRVLQETGNVDAFEELNQSAEQAQREIESTGRVSAATMADMERAIQQSGDRFNGMGDDARAGFSDIEQAIQNVQGDLQRLSSSGDLSDLTREAGRAGGELDDLADSARRADDELEDLGGDNGLDDLTESAEESSSALGSMTGSGGILAGVTAGLGGIVAAVGSVAAAGAGLYGFVKSSDELQKSVNNLQVQTGATSDEIDGMRDSLVNIYGNNYGESFQDIADSMAQVKGATQLTGDELEKATERSLLLRDSFGWEVPEQMNAVRVMMTEFGYSAEEAFTVLAQGQQSGVNGAEDLLDTFNEYSGAFADLGFDGEQAMNMITNSVREGARNTDVAADAVNEFATRIADGSDLTAESLEAAGLNATEMIGKFREGGPTAAAAFQEVTAAIGSISDPLKREQTAVGLFGTMAEDAGVQTVLALGNVEGQANATADTLEQMDAIKYNTIGEAITGVGRMAVSNILIPIQDRIMPGVNDSINSITDTIKTASGAIKAFIDGDESAADILSSYGLDPSQFQPLLDAVDQAKNAFSTFKSAAVPLMKTVREAIKEAMIDLWPVVTSTLSEAVAFVSNNLRAVTGFWQSNGEEISGILKRIAGFIKDTLILVWPPVRSAVSAVVGFIGENVRKIAQFWDENGATILAAVDKAFNGISAVIEFVMPLILGIIKMVWGNIKGVISGALDFIMGLVKTFSGLLTGDFSKMWEGLKQMFSGAVEFIWNFIQLTFYGKILAGAKTFILAFRTGFASLWSAVKALFTGNGTAVVNFLKSAWTTMWNATKTLFTNISTFLTNTWKSIRSMITGALTAIRSVFTAGWNFVRNFTSQSFTNIWNTIRTLFTRAKDFLFNTSTNIMNKVRDTWTALKTNTSNAFRDIFNSIKARFTDIVNAAKELPGRIGTGIGNMASKVTDGVTRVINTLARVLGKGVNGVIGGINWVLGKIGVDSEVPEWDVPQYAHGTGAHPGGMAVVGDGKGDNAGPELIIHPDGTQSLSPSRPTLVNLAKGTRVASAKMTKKLLQEVPHYALGIGKIVDWGIDKVKDTVGVVRSAATTIKDKAFDVFSYFNNPGKLLDLAMQGLGLSVPNDPSYVNQMAIGAVQTVKKSAIDFIKDKMGFALAQQGGGPADFGSAFRKSSSYGWRIHPITGKRTFHNGDDWAAPAGTPIPAQAAGQVIQAAYHAIRGNYVRIRSGDVERIYQHNTRNLVKKGDMVSKGQIIGTVGSTGSSTGPHLHYEVIKNGRHIRPDSLIGMSDIIHHGLATGGQKVSMAAKYLEAIVQDGDWQNDWVTHLPRNKWDTAMNYGKKAADYMKRYGSPAEKYFAAIAEDGDWLNDWATHVPSTVKNSMLTIGKQLASLQGYADGGIIGQKQLAWLAEGGWAESVISHDPAKRSTQHDIWRRTGEQLGFTDGSESLSREMLDVLERIAQGVESEQDRHIVMNDRVVGQLVERHVTEQQKREEKRQSIFKGRR